MIDLIAILPNVSSFFIVFTVVSVKIISDNFHWRAAITQLFPPLIPFHSLSHSYCRHDIHCDFLPSSIFILLFCARLAQLLVSIFFGVFPKFNMFYRMTSMHTSVNGCKFCDIVKNKKELQLKENKSVRIFLQNIRKKTILFSA